MQRAFSKFRNDHITDPTDLRELSAYFFWGGWASAAGAAGRNL